MTTTDLQVQGFQYAAVKSGIRGKDRLDLGLIYCEEEAVAAGVFTKNLVKAAPVLLGMERLKNNRLQAVLLNSGIANACTGELGMVNAKQTAAQVADELGISEDLVLVSSTGVIGMQLEMDCFLDGIPRVVKELSSSGGPGVASAIMTTDTQPKMASRTVMINGTEVKISGISKGAGMIMPNMATMLCFIMTDAKIEAAALQQMLGTSIDLSFNRITVDGDSSTNDTVLAMASGRADNQPVISLDTEAGQAFQAALSGLCLELAKMIVKDGEGATKLITVRVNGALSDQEADLAARTVANSALVKTAFFGQDANWGRIIGALGRSGAQFDAEVVDIAFDAITMVQDGLGLGAEVEVEASKVLRQDEFTVTIDLKAGDASTEIYTCDFSIDYVKINADYRT